MATDICTRRLTKELRALAKDPIKSPKITVAPNEANILEMHYVIEGSENTPYAGGIYHGKLIFPKDYPLKPPSVMMLTPNGRFQPNRRLCLSMSDFHPEVGVWSSLKFLFRTSCSYFSGDFCSCDSQPLCSSVSSSSCFSCSRKQSWNPMWSVSTILTGLYSFMLETAPTLGSIDTAKSQKQKFARQSLEFNIRDANFVRLFPEYVELHRQRMAARQTALGTCDSEVASTVLSQDPTTQARPNEAVEINGLFATAAGLIAVLSIIVAMRFL